MQIRFPFYYFVSSAGIITWTVPTYPAKIATTSRSSGITTMNPLAMCPILFMILLAAGTDEACR